MLDDAQIQHHATVVAWAGSGVMIIGKPGSGKTSLALHLMALGCDLVADDRTELYKQGDQLVARCPLAIQGQIEARGFGILQTPFYRKRCDCLCRGLRSDRTKAPAGTQNNYALRCHAPFFSQSRHWCFAFRPFAIP